MNRKGETSVLETIIGALIGIGVAAVTISTIFFLLNPGNPGQDSMRELAQKVREVNQQDPGSRGVVVFFQDQSTFYYPVTEKTRNVHIQQKKIFATDYDFILTHTKTNPNCETETCLCLCEEFDEDNTKRCVQGKLSCEQLPGVSLSPGTGQIISRGHPEITGLRVSESDLPPAQQRVQIIKCRGGELSKELYCKKSKPGDISIIFDWLDQKGVYNSIK